MNDKAMNADEIVKADELMQRMKNIIDAYQNELMPMALAEIDAQEKEIEFLQSQLDKTKKLLELAPYIDMHCCKILDDNEDLKKQLAESQRRADAAVKELTRQLKVPDDDICAHCRNQIECRQTECEQYESGVGATSVDGTEYPNFKWSCMDFDHGTCNKMQNTSCNGCFDNEYSGFEWRGPQAEKGETHE